MRKKFAILLGTVGIVAVGVLLFSAFESYVLNIRADVDTALEVNPHGTWDLGQVYPEEEFFTKTFVSLSDAAQNDPNLLGVRYRASCHSKVLPDGTVPLNACQWIQFDHQDSGLTFLCEPGEDPCDLEQWSLDRSNSQDGWGIDFGIPDCVGAHQKEPGVKDIECPAEVGAEVNFAVVGINRITKPIVDKDGDEVPPIAHPAGEFQYKGTARSVANARAMLINIGKADQEVHVARISAVAKTCGGKVVTTEFRDHLKDVQGDPLPHHEVWLVDFGSDCVKDESLVLFGIDMNPGMPDPVIKGEIVLLGADGSPVGALELH